MRIVLITGMPGAGKEELLGVGRSMGLPFLRMGDLVRESYSESHPEGMALGDFASHERDVHGRDVWARRAVQRMGGDMFLVDGCRSMDEVEAYRSLGEDVVILGIHAAPAERYRRLVARGRDDAPRSVAEFEERDAREMGWGISDVMALADAMVVNDCPLEEFKARAGAALERLT